MVGAELAFEPVRGQLAGGNLRDGGVADQRVDPGNRFQDVRRGLTHAGERGEIHADETHIGLVPEFCHQVRDRRPGLLGGAVQHHHFRAFVQQRPCGLKSSARVRAGDEVGLAPEVAEAVRGPALRSECCVWHGLAPFGAGEGVRNVRFGLGGAGNSHARVETEQIVAFSCLIVSTRLRRAVVGG